MQIKLHLDVSYENGVLVLASSTGRKLVFPASHEVQKKLEMVRKSATDQKPNISKLCKEYNLTREAFYQIYKKFTEADISIPFPQRDLYIKEMP